MNSLILNDYNPSGLLWLTAALIIVGVLLIIATISAIITRITICLKYNNFNKISTAKGHTAFSAARTLLDENGMSDVKVEQLGFFRALFYGNCYSKKNKTIYLRKEIINQTSITAVGIACQKVGLVIQDKEKNKTFKIRAFIAPFILFTPFWVVPLSVLGIIFDIMFSLGGAISIISIIFSIIIYLLSVIYAVVTIPVESRANKLALEFMEKTNILNKKERALIKELFSVFMIAYIIEFIISLLQVIKIIFEIILKVKSN